MAERLPNPTVEYRTPPVDDRGFRKYLRVYALYVVGCGGAPLALMLLVVPFFLEFFKSVKSDLPAVTRGVFQFSEFLGRGLWIVALGAIVALPFALAALTASLEPPDARRRLTRGITATFLVCGMGLILLTIAALLLPLLKLMTAVK